jgi:hypothetical protein
MVCQYLLWYAMDGKINNRDALQVVEPLRFCYNCLGTRPHISGGRKGRSSMTFAEADAQYEVLKQQYLAGALDEEQLDERLHQLMVLDEAGLWWAKSRENGSWHYYDASSGNWIAAAPPSGALTLPPPASLLSTPAAESQAKRASPAEPRAVGATPLATATGESDLPRWAAVKPATGAAPAAAGMTAVTAASGRSSAGAAAVLPSTSQGAPATSSYNARDFGPIAELTGGMKVLFYILALLLPVLGLILYFVYRNKPAQADRTAGRAFLILGIASIVFSCMCSTTFFLLESTLLGTGTRP